MDLLSSLLTDQSIQSEKSSDFDRIVWLTKLINWIQSARNSDEKEEKKETVYTSRLKYILHLLQKNPEWKNNFVTTLSKLLIRVSSTSQLSTAGLPTTNSFVQELFHRMQEKILPLAPLSEDLATLIYEIFPDADESLYIDFIDENILSEILDLFKNETLMQNKIKKDILSASYVLTIQILNTTFSLLNELSELSKPPQELVEFKLEKYLSDCQIQQNDQLSLDILDFLSQAEQHLLELYNLMKERGVKIELVYLFQLQKRKLQRLRILVQFLTTEKSVAANFRLFVSHLILETHHQKSLISFFSQNLSIMTERIVQANSHVGEHYLTFTWTEFRKMFQSAAGGGAVTAFTVFIKHALTELKFLGFIKGFFDSLNYSGSFLLIQIMGWTLATKQPSATAPYIASALSKSTSESRRSIIALLRTQFIAVFGNLSLVFPICFLISLVSLKLDHPLFSSEESLSLFSSSNIWGPSALYAVFTGFLLFSASLIAGWFENWVIINRLDHRIEFNKKLRNFLGLQRTLKLAEFIKINSNSLAANISLGFLLGMAPQFIKFLGVPIEVRHVTLATGNFAAVLPQALTLGINYIDLINSILGILLIGVLNISVSFALAFLLASISSHVRFSSLWKLLKWGLWLILTKPWLLLVPEDTITESKK